MVRTAWMAHAALVRARRAIRSPRMASGLEDSLPILVTEPSGLCRTSGRSCPQLSKGKVSGSAIYSPCCSRQPSQSSGHLLGSDGWLRTKEEDYLGRRAEAL